MDVGQGSLKTSLFVSLIEKLICFVYLFKNWASKNCVRKAAAVALKELVNCKSDLKFQR